MMCIFTAWIVGCPWWSGVLIGTWIVGTWIFQPRKGIQKNMFFLPSRKWSCTTVHVEFPTMPDVYGGLALGQAMVNDASLAKCEVLSHAKIFVRKRNRGFTRHGIFRKYLQTEHNRYQEIIWKNLSHGSPPTLIFNSKFHDFRNRWLYANLPLSPNMEMDSSSIRLAKVAENEPGQW